MSVRNIIPLNGKVLTIFKSVLSYLTLHINSRNELVLTRFSKTFLPLLNVRLIDFGSDYVSNLNFALSEDERGYIHIVMNFIPSMKLLIPYNISLDNITTLILKLQNDGGIEDVSGEEGLSNYNIVKVKGHCHLICNAYNNLQIRNLTTGGNIRYIFTDASLVLGVFSLRNLLFISGAVSGNITYEDFSVDLPRCACLFIFDTQTWKLENYFYATGDNKEKVCRENDCRKIITFASVISDGNYYIAGYTNIQSVNIYERQTLLKNFTLTGESVLFLCKITFCQEDEKIGGKKKKREREVTLIHHPFSFSLSQRLFLFWKGKDILLSGNSNNYDFLLKFKGKKPLSHISKYNFIILFDSNLKQLNSLFFGSGRLNFNTARACGCGDCPGDGYARYDPCRIMRLFSPGATTTANMGDGCKGTNKGIKFSGSTCNSNTKYTYNTSEGCVFTSWGGNLHCLPDPSYASNSTSPGDLYNTKYKGYSSLPESVTLAMVDSDQRPMYTNQSLIVDDSSGDVIVATDLIDSLVVDDQVEQQVYSEYENGYMMSMEV